MSTPTRRALYGKLSGDSTLNALLATPPAGWSKSIYYQVAPEGATTPFVILSKQSGTPTESFGDPSALENDIWLIKAVDSGSVDNAEAVQARIATLLNDATLSISGATLLYLRRQSDVDYSEVANGVVYRHAGSLYRLTTTD
jgi:hypothetical protein